jgi:transcriptional regulator with XRE-family HTH domain
MPTKKEFPKFLKETGDKFLQLRIKAGKDIPTVAAGSGLSTEEVTNIENGKSAQYELRMLYDLCKYYGVDAREYIGI